MSRKKLPPTIEAEVLVGSRRRCCVCFGLNRDIGVKGGQIAHLDHNPNNASADNLAYLCFEHHDQYDSTTSQSKGLTTVEVRSYREELHMSVLPVLEARSASAAPVREPGSPDAAPEWKARRIKERKVALVELISRAQYVKGHVALSTRLELSGNTTEGLLLDLAADGIVRIDRERGSLRKTYSLVTSATNRLLDTFIASIAEALLSETRYVRRRDIELDAVVRTAAATYIVETLVAGDRISADLVASRIRRLGDAKRQLRMDMARKVLIIGIGDKTATADADLKHVEQDGVVVRYVELGPA